MNTTHDSRDPRRRADAPPANPQLDFDPDGPAEGNGIYGLPHTPEEARVVLVPVPWDATTSYRPGAADGPQAILEASVQVDLFDLETGRPYEAGIAMLPIPEQILTWNRDARSAAERVMAAHEPGSAGSGPGAGAPGTAMDPAALSRDLDRVNELSARVNEWVETTWQHWTDHGKLVGVVGGDHASPLGAIRAAARRHPGLGVLHLDAHADLRAAYHGFRYSHASIFYNVLAEAPDVSRLVQVGLRDLSNAEHRRIQEDADRIRAFFDPNLQRRLQDGETWSAIALDIVDALPREVYVSFDIDGLDPRLCPNTGTPVPGGLEFHQTVALLRHLVESGRRIVGFDLCEVAPDPDRRNEWDANVGARLLYKQIGFALQSQ